MTLDTMLTLYNLLSASHLYILGFAVKGILYYVTLTFEELKQYTSLDHASSKRGGFAKVRIKLNKAQKTELLKLATICGQEQDLKVDSTYNKGDNFERIIVERFTQGTWKKNSEPFNVTGDIQINGENVQIKYDNCEITNEKFLKKLARA